MNRRETLSALLASAAATTSVRTLAQPAANMPLIGVLAPIAHPAYPAFIEGLRALGYEDGKTMRLLEYNAQGDYTRLAALARQLIDARPTVIAAINTPGSKAAIDATKTIPIVMVGVGDPVGSGFVASLGRPGGNVTGVSNMIGELAAKRLSILHELVPKARRIAVLYNPADPVNNPQLHDVASAAPRLGIDTRVFPVETPAHLEEVFKALVAWGAHAAIWLAGQSQLYQTGTIQLAARHKIPVMADVQTTVERGGLISYAPEANAIFRRGAYYVDRILKGARPADLPVEQPTRFELGLNLKTARALGISVPYSILIQATKVIE